MWLDHTKKLGEKVLDYWGSHRLSAVQRILMGHKLVVDLVKMVSAFGL